MPQIPTYDAPTVQSQPLPNARLNLDARGAFGEALGPAISNVGSVVEQYAKKEKEEAQAVAVNDANTRLQSAINDTYYNPTDGLIFKQGESAAAAAGPAYDKIAKARDKILEGLKDDDVKRIFSMHSNGAIEEAKKVGEIHVGQQVHVAKEASLKGAAAQSLFAIANNYAIPDQVARQEAQVEAPIRALQLSREDGVAKIAEWRQKVTATRLNQYVAAKDYQGAQALFSEQKDRLGPEAAQFEHIISTLKSQQVGDQTAIAAINGSRLPNGFIDETRAKAAIEKLPGGPDKEQAIEHFNKYNALEKGAELNKKANIYQTAFSAYLGNHSLADVPASTKSWLQQNDPIQWNALENIAYEHEHKIVDPVKTGNFIQVLADIEGNPLKYKGMNPSIFNAMFSSVLSLKDWERAGEKFAEAQKVKDPELVGQAATTVQEAFAKAFDLAKDSTKSWSADKLTLWRDVHDHLERQMKLYEIAHPGSHPSDEQLKKWADERLVSGEVVGGGTIYGDKSMRRVEAAHDPSRQNKPFVEDIPDEFTQKMLFLAKAKKLPAPTGAQIRAAYEARKRLEATSGGP